MTTAEAGTDALPFTIDGQLCFALHSASRAMTACYRQGLDALGLTYSQYAVMLVLWQHDAVSMGFLCEQLHLDSGTLSPLLKRLEKQGRVTRRRRPEDERTLEIACTDEGRSLFEHARVVQRDVERATGMTGSDLASLRGQLDDLAGRLRTATTLQEQQPVAQA
jgi:MarR family transcriptional regulator, organic hydroperoxide resistance regulator